MANPYPARFISDDVVRLQGELDFTDPDNQPGGGSIAVEFLSWTTPSAASHTAPTNLAFESAGGANLLDLTTPDAPTIIADGTYLFTFTIGLVSDVAFLFPVTVFPGGFAESGSVPPDATAGGANTPSCSVSVVALLSAGAQAGIQLVNPNAADIDIDAVGYQVTKLA